MRDQPIKPFAGAKSATGVAQGNETLEAAAVVLLALAPIGWRVGWWHFRFSLLTLMPWAAYFGPADVIVSILALTIGFSRLDWRWDRARARGPYQRRLIAYCLGTMTGSSRRCRRSTTSQPTRTVRLPLSRPRRCGKDRHAHAMSVWA